MRKLCYCLFFILPVFNCLAHDGTVNISGSIKEASCDIDTSSTMQNINLGDYESGDFASPGATSPSQPLPIYLHNCSSGISGATILFSGDADPDNPTLLALSNTDPDNPTAEMATGLGVQILESDGATPIKINDSSTEEPLDDAPDNTLEFKVRYMSTLPKVTSGSASAVMYFDITYK